MRRDPHPVRALRRIVGGLIVTALALVLAAAPAAAQTYRARISHDIAYRLAQRIEAPAEIIVSTFSGNADPLTARYGVTITKRLQGAVVILATGGQIDAITQDPDVAHVAGNSTVYRMMADTTYATGADVTTEATGADQVWAGLDHLRGITGRGVGVAVIDSGVYPHPALRNRILASVDFTNSPDGQATDVYGHGTHVAGIIAESGADGYSGMAPGAWIVNLKALGDDGSGKTADVIQAIDWAIQNRQQYNIRVINLSLGHPVFESYVDDPLCQAAQRAVDAGIVVVAAAGNFGKTPDGRPVVGGIIAPGNTPSVLTVGALNTRDTVVRSDDVMDTFSSRGPTAIDGVLKPDLVAPGNKIVAASAEGSVLSTTYPDRVVVDGPGGADYIELSGTSMSTAVVSGAAALVLEVRPGLSPAQVKAALQLTSSRLSGAGLVEEGSGSLNALAAVELVWYRSTQTLPITQIAGEDVLCSGFAYGSEGVYGSNPVSSGILVWGNGQLLTWGNASPQPITTWNGSVDPNILVWGNSVSPDILVWGSTVTSDILVWGNILVWGSSAVGPEILVWGSRTDANILVWGNSTDPQADILVWGNSQVTGDILVWGSAATGQPD